MIHKQYTDFHIGQVSRAFAGITQVSESLHLDCEAFDNENWLRAYGQRAADKMIKEYSVGGLLLLQLNPAEINGKKISVVRKLYKSKKDIYCLMTTNHNEHRIHQLLNQIASQTLFVEDFSYRVV